MREILSGLRKAVEEYQMIEEGDKIAVTFSIKKLTNLLS